MRSWDVSPEVLTNVAWSDGARISRLLSSYGAEYTVSSSAIGADTIDLHCLFRSPRDRAEFAAELYALTGLSFLEQ